MAPHHFNTQTWVSWDSQLSLHAVPLMEEKHCTPADVYTEKINATVSPHFLVLALVCKRCLSLVGVCKPYASPGKCLNTCLENVFQTGDTTRLSQQDSWSGDLLLHAASHCWNTGHCTSGGGRAQGLKTGYNFKERYQKKAGFCAKTKACCILYASKPRQEASGQIYAGYHGKQITNRYLVGGRAGARGGGN